MLLKSLDVNALSVLFSFGFWLKYGGTEKKCCLSFCWGIGGWGAFGLKPKRLLLIAKENSCMKICIAKKAQERKTALPSIYNENVQKPQKQHQWKFCSRFFFFLPHFFLSIALLFPLLFIKTFGNKIPTERSCVVKGEKEISFPFYIGSFRAEVSIPT